MDKIAVYIPDEEAKKFLLFQEYYQEFCLLIDSGVFKIRNGSAVIHFDKRGEIKAINRSDILYSSRFDT
jgi:hypothetical protein